MIAVRYNRRDTTISIKGHANSAPKGKDLVCAGASTLAFTLIAALQEGEARFRPVLSQHEGDLKIECSPTRACEDECRAIMDTIMTGFEVLADEYPDNVHTERED